MGSEKGEEKQREGRKERNGKRREARISEDNGRMAARWERRR